MFSTDHAPKLDPTPLFEYFRGSYGTELLTAAVAHFDVFGILSESPLSFAELRQRLGLQPRPATVLITALRAMNLIEADARDRLRLTELAAEHLVPGAYFDVSDYIGLAATSTNVLNMVKCLRTNAPLGTGEEEGVAFIYRQGMASAMETQELARHFTLALAGRAKNVAPLLAERIALDDASTLLDVAGGTGIYAIAFLQRNPNLRAILLDRPEVLKVASQFAGDYGVSDRVELVEADMFTDPLPEADVVLLSNVLHDWDAPQCRDLVQRCADVLPAGGRLLIHDVLLNDAHDGPLPVALYSAALFSLTEGRAYSEAEFRDWLSDAGLVAQPTIPTLIHCALLAAIKRG